MKLGLALPTGGDVADPAAIGRVAEEAERVGLDTLWVLERLLAPTSIFPTTEAATPYHRIFSPLESLAFAAAKTERIRLGTSVMVALLHNPADLGRRLATVDQLSGGRLDVGLGQGWNADEFAAAGVPMSRRGAGFEEFIEALRASWGPDPVSFSGRFYQYAESWISPKPVQAGGPPLLLAAQAPAAVRRTARMGFGLNPVWMGWTELEGMVTAFRDAAREFDSDPDDLPIVLRVNEPLTPAANGTEPSPVGSPEQVAEALPRLERLGVTETFWSMTTPVEEQLRLITELRDRRDSAA